MTWRPRCLLAVAIAAAFVTGCEGSPAPGPAESPTVAARPSPRETPTPTATLEPVAVVRVGGHRFATRCAGTGGTGRRSVMLVSGYGSEMALSWAAVQAVIGGFARVCAYDRLGVGASDKAPPSQDFDDMARDLDGVVHALSLPTPAVFVAHSLGGMVTVALAEEHREDVAGIVLVDATPPGFPEVLMAALRGKSHIVGVELELAHWRDFLAPAKNVEHLDGRTAFAAARRYPRLPGLPVVALTHSVNGFERTAPRLAASIETAWVAGQRRWAGLSDRGRVETATPSGHLIQQDRPDLVVAAVRELIRAR